MTHFPMTYYPDRESARLGFLRIMHERGRYDHSSGYTVPKMTFLIWDRQELWHAYLVYKGFISVNIFDGAKDVFPLTYWYRGKAERLYFGFESDIKIKFCKIYNLADLVGYPASYWATETPQFCLRYISKGDKILEDHYLEPNTISETVDLLDALMDPRLLPLHTTGTGRHEVLAFLENR